MSLTTLAGLGGDSPCLDLTTQHNHLGITRFRFAINRFLRRSNPPDKPISSEGPVRVRVLTCPAQRSLTV